MAKVLKIWLVALICFAGCDPVWGADANETGMSIWALGGNGVQEGRVGWVNPFGKLPNTELALGAMHVDAPDGTIEEWPIRGYAIAHALDASMLAQLLDAKFTLPAGNLYGGAYAEYTHDRDLEWSGGYVVGGLVEWPKGWQSVAEYQSTICNSTKNSYEFVLGLRRKF